MYITKIFPRRFFGFLGSFSPKIVCFLVLRKHLFRHKYHIKFVKMESKFFGNIHVDVKKSEESESGVIFTITRLKNGQKMRFVLGFWDIEFLTYPNKSIFWPILTPVRTKISPDSASWVILASTCIWPKMLRRFFGFLRSFSPKFCHFWYYENIFSDINTI